MEDSTGPIYIYILTLFDAFVLKHFLDLLSILSLQKFEQCTAHCSHQNLELFGNKGSSRYQIKYFTKLQKKFEWSKKMLKTMALPCPALPCPALPCPALLTQLRAERNKEQSKDPITPQGNKGSFKITAVAFSKKVTFPSNFQLQNKEDTNNPIFEI
jgi:hypothetical protein